MKDILTVGTQLEFLGLPVWPTQVLRGDQSQEFIGSGYFATHWRKVVVIWEPEHPTSLKITTLDGHRIRNYLPPTQLDNADVSASTPIPGVRRRFVAMLPKEYVTTSRWERFAHLLHAWREL